MKEYYVNPAGTQDRIGPMPESDLWQALQTGTYPPNTLVWCEGMSNWQPASDVFPAQPPPVPAAMPRIYEAPLPRPAQIPQPEQTPEVVTSRAPAVAKGGAICGIIFGALFCSFSTVVLCIISLCIGAKSRSLWKAGAEQGAINCAKAANSLRFWGWMAFIVNIPFMFLNLIAA